MIIEEEFFILLKFLINFDVVFVQEKNFIYRTILFDVEAIELGKCLSSFVKEKNQFDVSMLWENFELELHFPVHFMLYLTVRKIFLIQYTWQKFKSQRKRAPNQKSKQTKQSLTPADD